MTDMPSAATTSAISDATVDELLRGAVDLHCHSGPSVMPRLVDHIDALEDAGTAGMRAVLFKDHYYPTAPIVELVKDRYAHTGVEPLGSIVLNNALGGFNAYATEHALKMGSKVVWMPTVSAANHIREGHNKKLLVAKSAMRKPTALSVVDDHGDLKEEVKPILDLVAVIIHHRQRGGLPHGDLATRSFLLWPSPDVIGGSLQSASTPPCFFIFNACSVRIGVEATERIVDTIEPSGSTPCGHNGL